MAVSVVTAADGSRLVRGYGLSDHPNILGGLLAFASLLLVVAPGRDDPAGRVWAKLLFAAGAVAVLLTFSRSAGLALGGGVRGAGGDARNSARGRPRGGPACRRSGGADRDRLPPLRARVRAVCPRALRSIRGHRHGGALAQRARGAHDRSERHLPRPPRPRCRHRQPAPGASATPSRNSNYTYQPAHVVLLDVAAETGALGALLYLALLVTPWLRSPVTGRAGRRSSPRRVRPCRDHRRWPLRLLHLDLSGGPDLGLGRARALGRGLPACDRPGLRDRAAITVRWPQRGGGRCLRSCSSPRSSSISRSCSCCSSSAPTSCGSARSRSGRAAGLRPSRSRRTVAVGHRAAADLQRALRGAPARRRGRPRSTTRADRLEIQVLDDSTDETATIVADLVERLRRERPDLADPARPAHEPARLQGGRPRIRHDARAGRVARDLRRRLRAAAALPAAHAAGAAARTRASPSCRPAGATRTGATRCSPCCSRSRSTATSRSSSPPLGVGLLLQLQRHGRRLAAAALIDAGGWHARHPDRGPRPLLPRPSSRLARRLPVGDVECAGRAAGQLRRLPPPAAALGARQPSSARSSTSAPIWRSPSLVGTRHRRRCT